MKIHRAAMAALQLLHCTISTASQGCECLGAQPSILSSALVAAANTSASTCIVTPSDQTFRCFTASYGLACGTHDAGLMPDCAGDPAPAFCAQRWCYVDAAACHAAPILYEASDYFPGAALSYELCGGQYSLYLSQTKQSTRNALRGSTLRAGIPLSSYPLHYSVDAAGQPFRGVMPIDQPMPPLRGYWIDYYNELAEQAGFQMGWRHVSRGARAAHSSAWTACIADVQNGLLDICPTGAWMQPFRLEMSTFTMAVKLDRHYLMVRRPDGGSSLGRAIMFVFEPLESTLWLAIFLILLITPLVLIFLQPRKQRTLADYLHQYQDSFLEAVTELAAGATARDEQSTATKALKVGWTLFSVVIVTAYSASFTAMLVREQQLSGIRNVDDCVYQRCRLCLSNQLIDNTRRLYGNNIRYVQSPAFPSAQMAIPWGIAMVKNGSCAAFMLSESQYQEDAAVHDCGVVFTGSPVISIYVAQPVRSAYADTINYYHRQLGWTGESEGLERMRAAELARIGATYICNPWSVRPQGAVSTEQLSTEQLSMGQLSGAFVILSIFASVGIGIRCVHLAFLKFAPKTVERIRTRASMQLDVTSTSSSC